LIIDAKMELLLLMLLGKERRGEDVREDELKGRDVSWGDKGRGEEDE
jgi:hypothetical protein